jgi:hypothetical protein
MWHYHMPSLQRMLELLVVSFATGASPTIAFKSSDNLFAVH